MVCRLLKHLKRRKMEWPLRTTRSVSEAAGSFKPNGTFTDRHEPTSAGPQNTMWFQVFWKVWTLFFFSSLSVQNGLCTCSCPHICPVKPTSGCRCFWTALSHNHFPLRRFLLRVLVFPASYLLNHLPLKRLTHDLLGHTTPSPPPRCLLSSILPSPVNSVEMVILSPRPRASLGVFLFPASRQYSDEISGQSERTNLSDWLVNDGQ